MSKTVKIFLFCACCLAFIGCDRITKDLAKEHLKDKPEISYLKNTVRLLYVENTGAALSMGDNLPKTVSFWLLSIFPLVILTGLLLYTLKNMQEISWRKMICFAMIFSGGISNIIDRMLFDRHVTDFLNVGFGSLRTGIFNVADMFVTAGVIGLLFFYNDHQQPATEKPNNTISQ